MSPKSNPPRNPIVHSNLRRAHWHDYSGTGFYMITVVATNRRHLFGELTTVPFPHIVKSPLGKRIADVEIAKINRFYPNVKLLKLCVMPDHLHFILHVASPFREGKHLGHIIAYFKAGCTKAHREISGCDLGPIFEQGYHDRLVTSLGQISKWKKYLDDNPRRLALKISNPDYFTVRHHVDLLGIHCEMVGNRFLIDIPDKVAVIVHRGDSPETFAANKAKWISCGLNGGVIVSAAIAKREKEVMREAMDCGCRIILLRHNGFPPLYKPSGKAFDACASGQLLQISCGEYTDGKDSISRLECLFLNSFAERLTNL